MFPHISRAILGANPDVALMSRTLLRKRYGRNAKRPRENKIEENMRGKKDLKEKTKIRAYHEHPKRRREVLDPRIGLVEGLKRAHGQRMEKRQRVARQKIERIQMLEMRKSLQNGNADAIGATKAERSW